MSNKNDNPFGFLKSNINGPQRGSTFSTENLFTENNPHGYFSRGELREYLSGITQYQQKKFVLFFEHISNGHKITSLPIPMEDEYGNEILWVKFNVNGNRQTLRMYSNAWLISLVKDYNEGKLHGLSFSAQLMAEELKKVQQ